MSQNAMEEPSAEKTPSCGATSEEEGQPAAEAKDDQIKSPPADGDCAETESKTIDQLRKEVKELKSAIAGLEERAVFAEEEKTVLTNEIREMSGMLIEQARQWMEDANREKETMASQLKISKSTEEELRIQNEHLKKIIEKRSEKKFSGFGKLLSHRNQAKKDCSDEDLEHGDKFGGKRYTMGVNNIYRKQFLDWYNGDRMPESEFFQTIVRDDVLPCLSFPQNSEAQKSLRVLMESWTGLPTIHPDITKSNITCDFTKVSFTGRFYRVKLSGDKVYVACTHVRDMLVAIMDLYSYINYIIIGVVKLTNVDQIYEKIAILRAQISLARDGFVPSDSYL